MNVDVEKILAQVAQKARLAEGSEGVYSVLQTMYRNPRLKNKKVAQKTGIAVPALAAVRGELKKAAIIEKRNFLGEKGRNWIKNNLGLTFDYNPFSKDDLDHYIKNIENIEEINQLTKMKEVLPQRPEPEFALDQSRATYETILKRVLYLIKKGRIEGRDVILLGDDDATSIALGLTGLPNKITVIDIDDRVLDFLDHIAQDLNIRELKTIKHDLREPCPNETLNQFDLVITDPPYTNEGIRLFLKRARQVLRSTVRVNGQNLPIIGKNCFLCFGNKPPNEQQQIQLSIFDHDFIIKDMIPAFNHYKGARILGQFSHLYYLQTINHPDLGSSLQHHHKRPLYTREVRHSDVLAQRPLGYHFIGEYFGLNEEILQNNQYIRKILLDTLQEVELNIIDVYQHQYVPYGYSVIVILQTSHAAIHTWPEHQYASIDIFLCDKKEKGEKALEILQNKLKPKNSEIFFVKRGEDSSSTEYLNMK